MAWQRPDGRQANELRPVSFELDFTRFAAGSVLTRCGHTQVLCTVSIEDGVPPFFAGFGARLADGRVPDVARGDS